MKLTIFACLIAALSLAFSKVELLGVTIKKPPSKQQPSKGKKGNQKNQQNNKNGKGKGKEKTEAQKRKEMQAKAAEQRKKAAAAAEKRRKELLAAEKKRLQARVTIAKGEIQEAAGGIKQIESRFAKIRQKFDGLTFVNPRYLEFFSAYLRLFLFDNSKSEEFDVFPLRVWSQADFCFSGGN